MKRARESRLPLQAGKNVRTSRSRAKPAKPTATKHAKRRESDRKDKPRLSLGGDRKEILAVLFVAASLITGLALVSYDPATSGNLIGWAGASLASALFGTFGLGAFVLPFSLFLGFLGLVRPLGKQPGLIASAAWLTLLACLAMLIDVSADVRFFGARAAGDLGGAAVDALVGVFSGIGTGILVTASMAVALVIATGVKWSRIALVVGGVARSVGVWLAAFVHTQMEQHRAERAERLAEEEAAEEALLAEEEALAGAAFTAELDSLAPQTAESRRRRRKEEATLEADLDGRVAIAADVPKKPAVVSPPAAGAAVARKVEAEGTTQRLLETEAAEDGRTVPVIPSDPAWAAGPVAVPSGRSVSLSQEKAAEKIVETEPAEAQDAAMQAESRAEEQVEKESEKGKKKTPAPIIDIAPAAQRPETEAVGDSGIAEDVDGEEEDGDDQAEDAALPPHVSPAAAQALVKAGRPPAANVPLIDVPKAPPRPKKIDSPFDLVSESGFSLPPLSLLEGSHEEDKPAIDEALLQLTAERLRQKLADFGINGHVERIRPGPVVTMYEFAPAAGVKISKIAGLSDDLAMALEALRVRIVAPIPGRGVVGIEVPNKKREIVYLREILEQDAFRKSASKLTMALGKDIEGLPFAADLRRMPHLLISGTTGSGKSVSVNAMIMSLLFKATPEEVRFIMVDPKMLELSIYEGIPHLLLPVVTDPRKAALALRWAVDEMERRYSLLAETGVRDLATFNKLVADKLKEREQRDLELQAQREAEALKRAEAGDEDGDGDAGAPANDDEDAEEFPHDPIEDFLEKKHAEEMELKKLPYLVIIIDELADLMMVASKEVETYIARIAQKARAAGIHLMVATQRPSVDVVTGLIKANFPARISFLLRSRVDSQTILDQPGAEKLLGMGDMLILPPTSAHVQRVHGALVTEVEIKKVVDHLKAQGSPVYDESILKAPEEDGEAGGVEDDLSDELYDQAIAIISEMKTVSISMLQRKMRIGYNRSARMIERMERDGIVGAADGARPREVLIRDIGEMSG